MHRNFLKMKDLFSFDFLKCLIESASDKNIPVRIQNDFNHIVKILKTFGEPHESIKNERKVKIKAVENTR